MSSANWPRRDLGADKTKTNIFPDIRNILCPENAIVWTGVADNVRGVSWGVGVGGTMPIAQCPQTQPNLLHRPKPRKKCLLFQLNKQEEDHIQKVTWSKRTLS